MRGRSDGEPLEADSDVHNVVTSLVVDSPTCQLKASKEQQPYEISNQDVTLNLLLFGTTLIPYNGWIAKWSFSVSYQTLLGD